MSEKSKPATRWVAVTPSDATNLAVPCRGIYATGAGNVVLVGDDDVTGTFIFAAGEIKALGAKRVNATDTTATGIIALY